MAFGTLSVDRITSSDYTLIDNYIADSGRPLTNRNLIINGAMQVAQRNTSVTGITSGGYRTADRWYLAVGSAGTWTMNVESVAPSNTEFRKSANVICTTADSSLGASDSMNFRQFFEGLNVQTIKKGTSAAESLTLSFWVKSSNTGTYICELYDEDNSRQISKSYTIDVADTWEKKTITVPPDTTGQLDNDNENSFTLQMWLAAGSNFTSGTLNSSAWASSTNANRAVGQLNLANRVGNYLAWTGVQLETGTVATPYEWLDYGTELAKCQRYFQSINTGILTGIGNGAATTASVVNEAFCPLFVPLRASPTMGSVSVTQVDADSISSTTVTPTVNGFNANRQLVLNFTGLNADLLDNRACFIRINAPLTMNAEL